MYSGYILYELSWHEQINLSPAIYTMELIFCSKASDCALSPGINQVGGHPLRRLQCEMRSLSLQSTEDCLLHHNIENENRVREETSCFSTTWMRFYATFCTEKTLSCFLSQQKYRQINSLLSSVGAAAQMSLSQIGKWHLLHQSHAISIVIIGSWQRMMGNNLGDMRFNDCWQSDSSLVHCGHVMHFAVVGYVYWLGS